LTAGKSSGSPINKGLYFLLTSFNTAFNISLHRFGTGIGFAGSESGFINIDLN
jgi:hypothetical protein